MGTTLSANGTKVGGLTSIGGIEETTETIDVTTLDSDGGSREHIAGFSSPGEVSLEGFLLLGPGGLDDGQREMKRLKDTGEKGSFAIEFPGGAAAWLFDGIVTTFGTSFGLEDAVAFSCTVTVSGKPVFRTGGGAGHGGFGAAAGGDAD